MGLLSGIGPTQSSCALLIVSFCLASFAAETICLNSSSRIYFSLQTPLTIYHHAFLTVISKALVVFVINVFSLLIKLVYLGGGRMEETADARWVK